MTLHLLHAAALTATACDLPPRRDAFADIDVRDSVRARCRHGGLASDALKAPLTAGAQQDALADKRTRPLDMHAGLCRAGTGHPGRPRTATQATDTSAVIANTVMVEVIA
ncbi:hypothetical protein [Sphingomonas sp. Mn802worker]|uniref:hypothetical protein n=1 Tax=Sphingomonas sp. Mn802worker TaxID=629773 RepID=UPI00036EC764|nr:hypothetical protein [Sphingomonas sp. Mn802worker]